MNKLSLTICILSISLLLFTACVGGLQEIIPEQIQQILDENGNILSTLEVFIDGNIHEEVYKEKIEEGDLAELWRNKTTFIEEGVPEVEQYSRYGVLHRVTEYDYVNLSLARAITKVENIYYLDSNGNQRYREEYIYDEYFLRLIRKNTWMIQGSDENLRWYVVFEYDGVKTVPTTEKTYSDYYENPDTANVYRAFRYVYDENEKLLEVYDSLLEEVKVLEYEYNEEGLLSKERRYNDEQVLLWEKTYFYEERILLRIDLRDANGLLLKSKVYE